MAPRILVVRFSSIGDLVLLTPLLRAIRARHPQAELTVVVREDLADILRHNPRLTRLVTWRKGTPLAELARTLRATPWTHRLDLHGSLRSLALRRLVGGRWTTYPKHRVRRAMLIRSGGRYGGDLGPVAERYFAAAAPLEVAPDGLPAELFTGREDETAAERFLAEHRLGHDRGIVAIAPGAAHFTKRWPVEHWEALVRRLRGARDVVVLGGPAEREAADAIVAAGGDRVVSAAGQFSLLGTAALLKRVQVLAAGDTGVLHMASAVGTPVVGLYGPGIRQFGFFPYRGRAVVLEQPLACRPCSPHGGPRCPEGHHRCLRDTLPEAVAAAMLTPPR
ncbi:MAG TPA: glycosyltransferase family 9 protein [Gemmatimonadales bacterium]|nr:glycosyltransferase family 9 protein [Gemmatimonadales bacterium]